MTTAAERWAAGEAVPDVRPEQLRAASWRAARYGLSGPLLDDERGELVAPRVLVDRLVERVRPALVTAGDLDVVTGLVDHVFAHGDGARRQRAAYARRGELKDVVELVVRETVA